MKKIILSGFTLRTLYVWLILISTSDMYKKMT